MISIHYILSHRSKFILPWFFVSLIVALELHHAQADALNVNEMTVEDRKLCGYRLNDALDLVCHGRFNRREERETRDYPGRSRTSAIGMKKRSGGHRFRRNLRGIVEECCFSPCSFTKLSKYCGN